MVRHELVQAGGAGEIAGVAGINRGNEVCAAGQEADGCAGRAATAHRFRVKRHPVGLEGDGASGNARRQVRSEGEAVIEAGRIFDEVKFRVVGAFCTTMLPLTARLFVFQTSGAASAGSDTPAKPPV